MYVCSSMYLHNLSGIVKNKLSPFYQNSLVTWYQETKIILYAILSYIWRSAHTSTILVSIKSWTEHDFHTIYDIFYLGKYVTQGQFLCGVQLVWIQSFPYPWLVIFPRLNNSLLKYLTIPEIRTDRFIPFPRLLTRNKKQTPLSRIELVSLIPFTTTITVTLDMCIRKCESMFMCVCV